MNKPYIKLICIILKYLTYKEYLNIYTHYQYHTVLLFALNFTVVQLIISPFVYYDLYKLPRTFQNAAASAFAGASEAAVLLAGAVKAAASPLAGASKAAFLAGSSNAAFFAGSSKAAAFLAGSSKAAASALAGASKAAFLAGSSKAAAFLAGSSKAAAFFAGSSNAA